MKPCPIASDRAADLGNLEEFLRPFLGWIVSTDGVRESTRVRRKPEGDYGIVHPLHCRFAGDRRTYMVSDGIQSGSQRKTQGYRFAGTSGNQRCAHGTAQDNGHCFSRAFATANRHCSSPKVPFREPAHCCLYRDFACFPSGETQFVNDGITNTNLEFRDSASGVRRTFRNASARLLTQSSNQTLTEKPQAGVAAGMCER
jgi:hypothetical protein